MFTKNRKRKRSIRAGFVVTASAAGVGLSASIVLAQDPSYRVTDLGVFVGDSEAYDISNQNHVVGWSDQSVLVLLERVTKRRAFLWMPEGSVPVGFPTDLVAGLNDLQVLAGADLLFA